MSQEKHHKKKSEIENEYALKKKSDQHGNEASVDLPGIVQRITSGINPRQTDILHLQRTVGNQKTRRMLRKTSISPVASGTIQRHSPPEADAMYGQSRAEVTAAKDQTKSGLMNAEGGAKAMLSTWNSLMNAYTSARDLPVPSPEGSQSEDSEDIYE